MDRELPFKSLEESNPTNASDISSQLAEPTNVERSMVEKSPLDGSVMAYSSEPASPEKISEEARDKKLDGIRAKGESASATASVCRNLGVLGAPASSEASKVCSEIQSFTATNLRAVDICRLLNSTPLGRVLDERQLYRHRLRAGLRIQEGRRIHLLRYAAWLSEVRHTRIDERDSPVPRPGPVTTTKVLKLLDSQRYRCALTGRKLAPITSALDHMLPISRNGTNNIENAQVLHSDVNRAKGALTNDEFVALCREVAAWSDKAKTRAHGAHGRAPWPTQTEEPM